MRRHEARPFEQYTVSGMHYVGGCSRVPGGEELAWEAEFAKEEEERLIYAVYVA